MIFQKHNYRPIAVIAIITLAFTLLYVSFTGGGSKEVPFAIPTIEQVTFEDLLDAIEWVESKSDANAVGDNGRAVGSFQIHKIYVDDVNRINRLSHTDKYSHPVQWDYQHRLSKVASRWMVKTYLEYYGGTFEEMARNHNGGPIGHKKESTKAYWLKVKNRLEKK